MGLRDLFKNVTSSLTPDLLDPLLKSAGIDAALVDYDPSSRQVILALQIHGQTRYIAIAAGRRYTRGDICQLIADTPAEARQRAGAPEAPGHPPPA